VEHIVEAHNIGMAQLFEQGYLADRVARHTLRKAKRGQDLSAPQGCKGALLRLQSQLQPTSSSLSRRIRLRAMISPDCRSCAVIDWRERERNKRNVRGCKG
jgi:hypothetical protein